MLQASRSASWISPPNPEHSPIGPGSSYLWVRGGAQEEALPAPPRAFVVCFCYMLHAFVCYMFFSISVVLNLQNEQERVLCLCTEWWVEGGFVVMELLARQLVLLALCSQWPHRGTGPKIWVACWQVCRKQQPSEMGSGTGKASQRLLAFLGPTCTTMPSSGGTHLRSAGGER